MRGGQAMAFGLGCVNVLQIKLNRLRLKGECISGCKLDVFEKEFFLEMLQQEGHF
jgi:hypothetical protein